MGCKKLLVWALVLAFALVAFGSCAGRLAQRHHQLPSEFLNRGCGYGNQLGRRDPELPRQDLFVQNERPENGETGVRNFVGTGDVYNLKAASDLAGTYQKPNHTGPLSILGE